MLTKHVVPFVTLAMLACRTVEPELHVSSELTHGEDPITRTVTVQTPNGTEQLEVREVDGWWVHGDMLIDPADAVFTKAGPIVSAGNLWDVTAIPWRVEDGSCVTFNNEGQQNVLTASNFQTDIETALGEWAERTPFSFVEWTGETNYIEFKLPTQSVGTTINGTYVPFCSLGCSSGVGMGDPTTITLRGCSLGNIRHEIGHALGLRHEQSRADRDSHIQVDAAYLSEAAWTVHLTDSYGPFDFDSVMLYDSDSACNTPVDPYPRFFEIAAPGTASVKLTNCVNVPGQTPEGWWWNAQRLRVSAGDASGIWQTYHHLVDRPPGDDDDQFGTLVSTGDIDGDGLTDLVALASRDNEPDTVYVYKGAWAQGLPPASAQAQEIDPLGWISLTLPTVIGSVTALHLADWDADGRDELFVGLPHHPGGGRVFVYDAEVSGLGLSPAVVLEPPAPTTALQYFEYGAAVTSGDFSTAEGLDVVVGAPGTIVAGTTTGAVLGYRGSRDPQAAPRTNPFDVVTPEDQGPTALHVDAEFGAALTTMAAADPSRRALLAVGAPGDDDPATGLRPGSVHVFQGRGAGTFDDVALIMGTQALARFGAALDGTRSALADPSAGPPGGGTTSLAIGEPEADFSVSGPLEWDVGRVTVVQFDAAETIAWSQELTQAGMGLPSDAFDGFGSAVALGDLDGDGLPELAVGIPGFNNRGAVAGFTMDGTNWDFFWARTASDSFPATAAGPRSIPGSGYGSALAIGPVRAPGSFGIPSFYAPAIAATEQIVVGAPGIVTDGTTTGGVAFLRRKPLVGPPAGSQPQLRAFGEIQQDD